MNSRFFSKPLEQKPFQNKVIAIFGHTGSGKSTLRRQMVTAFEFFPVKSLTTRPKRFPMDGEYHFVTKEVFEKALKAKELINVNKYEGNYYGIPKKVFLEPLPYTSIIITDASNINKLEKFGQQNNVRFIFIYMEIASLYKVRVRLLNRKTPERIRLVEEEKRYIRKHFKKQLEKSYILESFDLHKIMKICEDNNFLTKEEASPPE